MNSTETAGGICGTPRGALAMADDKNVRFPFELRWELENVVFNHPDWTLRINVTAGEAVSWERLH